jgi:subtilase family serine protease
MILGKTFERAKKAVLIPLALFAVAAAPAHAGGAADVQKKVAPTRANATDLGLVNPSDDMKVTVFLNMHNRPAFDAAVEALYDPKSPTYQHWMTSTDFAKYAPTAAEIETVKKELEKHGLTILSVDPDNFSVRAHGATSSMEEAFQTHIHQYAINGRTFRANAEPATLTGAAGSLVAHVSGLEVHSVKPMLKYAVNPKTGKQLPKIPMSKIKLTSSGLSSIITDNCILPPQTFTYTTYGANLPVGVYYGNVYAPDTSATSLVCAYTASQITGHYGLPAAYKEGLNGKGKTVVLLEAFGYPTMLQDANAFSQLMGLPALNSSNFRVVYPDGPPTDPNAGVLLGWDGEIALDIQWAHSFAPGANIVVVAASGQDNEDFQDGIRYVQTHNLGHVISNSWEIDTDLIAGAGEQNSFNEVIELASAAGISVDFSSGDGGDEGLGSPVGAVGVPSNSPWATAVGGTTVFDINDGSGHRAEYGWGNNVSFIAGGGVLDPPEPGFFLGGAGGGSSLFFAKPSYQSSIPGTGRQVPDISALADPYSGVAIVLTEDGTQYFEPGIGGTSLACPIFSAIWAIAIQNANRGLGDAARVIATMPPGAVHDVLPLSSPTNISGTVYDSNGATYYSYQDLFAGLTYTQTSFLTANWVYDSEDSALLSFGTDSSLTVTPGWDNVTGWGVPNGLTFIKAAAGTPAP